MGRVCDGLGGDNHAASIRRCCVKTRRTDCAKRSSNRGGAAQSPRNPRIGGPCNCGSELKRLKGTDGCAHGLYLDPDARIDRETECAKCIGVDGARRENDGVVRGGNRGRRGIQAGLRDCAVPGENGCARGSCNTGNWRAMGGLCLLYTSPSPRDPKTSRMPSSA